MLKCSPFQVFRSLINGRVTSTFLLRVTIFLLESRFHILLLNETTNGSISVSMNNDVHTRLRLLLFERKIFAGVQERTFSKPTFHTEIINFMRRNQYHLVPCCFHWVHAAVWVVRKRIYHWNFINFIKCSWKNILRLFLIFFPFLWIFWIKRGKTQIFKKSDLPVRIFFNAY